MDSSLFNSGCGRNLLFYFNFQPPRFTSVPSAAHNPFPAQQCPGGWVVPQVRGRPSNQWDRPRSFSTSSRAASQVRPLVHPDYKRMLESECREEDGPLIPDLPDERDTRFHETKLVSLFVALKVVEVFSN